MGDLTPADLEKLAMLRLQYEDLGAEANAIKSARNSIFSIGSTLLLGGFLYGRHEANHWLVAAVPVAFAGLLLFSVQLFANSRAQGGYRQYVEGHMNAILSPERPLFVWEEVASGAMTRSALLTGLFIMGLYVGVTAGSIANTFLHLSSAVAALQVVAMLVLTLMLGVSLRSARQAYPFAVRGGQPGADALPRLSDALFPSQGRARVRRRRARVARSRAPPA